MPKREIRFLILLAMLPCVFQSCLAKVTNLQRQKEEATLIIVRDEGNSDSEVYVYVDSLYVGITKKGVISEIVIPAGKHYILFEYGKDFTGRLFYFKPNSVLAIRQFVLYAYVYKHLSTEGIDEKELTEVLKNLPKDQYAYYVAKEKMRSNDFLKLIKGDLNSDAFKVTLPGYELKIGD